MKLSKKFFQRPTLTVAKELLGTYLVVCHGRHILSGKIVETEAYIGEKDKACHASRGRTPRSETLYGEAGTIYVYLVYGMYHCFNIVTERKDYPAAVLVRAVEPREGIAAMQKRRKTKAFRNLASGPGKLCMAFGIDRKLNGAGISNSTLWIEDRGEHIAPRDIQQAKRIGVAYAGECKDYLWRFYINK